MSSSANKLEKPRSRMQTMASMIKMPSSTSNSASTTTDGSKKIDDVPLNEKVSQKTSSKENTTKSKTKSSQVAPVKSQTTNVIGNKDLKLKVSHNDAGRVIISLSNLDKVLVQVQVDESVLKKGALKKGKKTVEKERPRNKKPTITKKKPLAAATESLALYNSSKTPTTEQPRDLPDEETRGKKSSKDKKKSGQTTTADEHRNSKVQVPSSADSLGSYSMACSDDDSTRSPKDLFRVTAATAEILPADTPRPSDWDRRKQKLMKFKRQSSGLSNLSGHSVAGPEKDSAGRPSLHDFIAPSMEAKMEETASQDGAESGVFASPFQQRRLLQRRKRLDRQRADNETAFRSTRSIRSTASGDASALDPPSRGSGVGQFRLATDNPQTNSNDGSTSQDSANKARHTRTALLPSDDDEDDSKTATSNRIRSSLATLTQVRKAEMADKGGNLTKGTDEELLLPSDHLRKDDSKAKKWVTKLCDKVCHKRSKKDPKKLLNRLK